jgi:DNA-binding response OmpR family regulator
LKFGDLTIDLAGKRALCGADKLLLTPKEYDVLHYFVFCAKAGKVVTKGDLYAYLYSEQAKRPKQKILDVFMFRVRDKLDDAGSQCRILTLGHSGFRLSYNLPAETPQ